MRTEAEEAYARGKLSRLPRRKGALKKAWIERGIGFRTPNSWSDLESDPSLDDIEVLLQSTKDSDLKMVQFFRQVHSDSHPARPGFSIK